MHTQSCAVLVKLGAQILIFPKLRPQADAVTLRCFELPMNITRIAAGMHSMSNWFVRISLLGSVRAISPENGAKRVSTVCKPERRKQIVDVYVPLRGLSPGYPHFLCVALFRMNRTRTAISGRQSAESWCSMNGSAVASSAQRFCAYTAPIRLLTLQVLRPHTRNEPAPSRAPADADCRSFRMGLRRPQDSVRPGTVYR